MHRLRISGAGLPVAQFACLSFVRRFANSENPGKQNEERGCKTRLFTRTLAAILGACTIALLAEMAVRAEATYTEKILYSFPKSVGEGTGPNAPLIRDASGNLYGTTYSGGILAGNNGYGTVFELMYSYGTYTEKVLYAFTNSGGDGAYPYQNAGLVIDASGNLYGTTYLGGANRVGTVFELVNSSGTYREKVLHSFNTSGNDGAYPWAGLILDASGNLYGTTYEYGAYGGGNVFELVNSSGTWSEKVLYSFGGTSNDGLDPTCSLMMDAASNLYGTTTSGGANDYGTVFELVNASRTYREKVLYSFKGPTAGDGAGPFGGVTADAAGNLYGTTNGGGYTFFDGTVYELVKSSGTYTEEVLYTFTGSPSDGENPQASVVLDAAGNIYGISSSYGSQGGTGTAWELVNSSGTYTELALHSFHSGNGDGYNPEAALIMDGSGNLYGTTSAGGSNDLGTVFELTPSTPPPT